MWAAHDDQLPAALAHAPVQGQDHRQPARVDEVQVAEVEDDRAPVGFGAAQRVLERRHGREVELSDAREHRSAVRRVATFDREPAPRQAVCA